MLCSTGVPAILLYIIYALWVTYRTRALNLNEIPSSYFLLPSPLTPCLFHRFHPSHIVSLPSSLVPLLSSPVLTSLSLFISLSIPVSLPLHTSNLSLFLYLNLRISPPLPTSSSILLLFLFLFHWRHVSSSNVSLFPFHPRIFSSSFSFFPFLYLYLFRFSLPPFLPSACLKVLASLAAQIGELSQIRACKSVGGGWAWYYKWFHGACHAYNGWDTNTVLIN